MSWRVAATLALTTWGAVMFGAVYPWAFLPLFAACALTGAATLVPSKGTGRPDAIIAASLVLVVAAIGVQLIPLSRSFLLWISPETDVFLRFYEVGYPAFRQNHGLSIEPRSTMFVLAASGALTLLLLGLARALTRDDTRQIVRGLSVLGAVLALIGIVQKAMWNGKIYGFWTPIYAGDPFGPFVNRNHFAGWMLMVLPMSLGYFCGRVARGMRGVQPGWRNRVLWFSSRDANETILVGFAVLLMALALMLTMSRSGIVGLLAALAMSGWFVARRQACGSRRVVLATYLIFLAVAAVGWTGFDRLVTRFAQPEIVGYHGRPGIWADTRELAKRFPIAGTGLGTYSAAMVSYQTVDLTLHFAQAHNDYLQLIAEGGALVCIPAALAILALARTIRHRLSSVSSESTDYWIRTGAVTGIAAIALQEVGDFSLQLPGNAVLFIVLLALAARRTAAEPLIP